MGIENLPRVYRAWGSISRSKKRKPVEVTIIISTFKTRKLSLGDTELFTQLPRRVNSLISNIFAQLVSLYFFLVLLNACMDDNFYHP